MDQAVAAGTGAEVLAWGLLEPGDVIAFALNGPGDYDHIGIYIDAVRGDCHASRPRGLDRPGEHFDRVHRAGSDRPRSSVDTFRQSTPTTEARPARNTNLVRPF
jgi:hypothetical protein